MEIFTRKMKLYPEEIIPIRIIFQNLSNDNPLNYFVVFLDFGYFFFYLPFKMDYLKTGKYYQSTSSPFHKGTCAIVHILSTFRFAISIREILESYSEPNPVLYFEISRACLTFIYMLAFKYTFWRNQLLFVTIINELNNLQSIHLIFSSRRLKIKTISTVICALYCVTPIITVIIGSGVIHVMNWEPIYLLESYAGATRHVFLLQNNTDPYPISNFHAGTYLLIILYIVMNFYYFLGGHLFDLTVLMGALTLRHLGKGLEKTVDSVGDPYYIKTILDEYAVVKGLSKKINRAIGCVTFCFVVEALPYYATHLDDVLTLTDGYAQFRYLFYVVNFFSILVIASDIPIRVDSFRHWLSIGDNCVTLPSSKLIVLMNELNSHPIALKAGGFFPITYGFIGTMVSVVITYAVIILQFNNTACHRHEDIQMEHYIT